MCENDEAQLVIFCLLDATDDTKQVLKSIVPEITDKISSLYTSTQGRRSLLYLLVPRNRRHFTPAQIASLAETDEARSRTSKKDDTVRQSEIRAGASEALLAWVKVDGEKAVRQPEGTIIIGDIMLYADGDKSSANETLLRAISSPYPAEDASPPHPIDLPHSSRLYKTLLQGGHFNRKTEQIERVPSWDPCAFAVQLMDTLDQDVIVGMCTKGERNGAFAVAELCNALSQGKGQDVSDAKSRLSSWFTNDVKKDIKGGSGKGRDLLLEKLKSISS
jgi:pumilio homology domain family member 6